MSTNPSYGVEFLRIEEQGQAVVLNDRQFAVMKTTPRRQTRRTHPLMGKHPHLASWNSWRALNCLTRLVDYLPPAARDGYNGKAKC